MCVFCGDARSVRIPTGMFLGAGIRSLESAAADATGPPVPGSSGGAAPALAAASTETFERFQRYPVEDQSFSSMSGTPPTAYYRDEFVGGETFASGANEGHDLRAALQFKWRSHSDLEQHRFSQQLCF